MFLHAPGCNNTFVASDVTDEAISNAKLLHFGYPTLMEKMFEEDGRELVALFQRAKDLGATTSLDVSLPDLTGPAGHANWRTILTKVLPYTDLFLPSAEELLFMLDREAFLDYLGKDIPVCEFNRLSELAISLGAKVVAVKAGACGLYLKTSTELQDLGRAEPDNLSEWQGREMWAPVFEVEVAGTTGAGDATIAGLLMGWLKSMSPTRAIRAATAVGACCCEKPDAVSGVRSWEETEQRMNEGWEIKPVEFPENWVFGEGVYEPLPTNK